MKKDTTNRNMEKKPLEPADLKYVSGGTDEIMNGDDIPDEEYGPGSTRMPYTRYPPKSAQ